MFDGNDKNPMNELMLTMLGAFAQFERSIMLERQREGIAIAKAKGKYKGRKSSLTNEQMQEMKVDFNNGMKKTEIAEKYGVTRSYVYQLVKKNHHGLGA
jgi:DNA invertase Pin-like site-specific DNA recombinase